LGSAPLTQDSFAFVQRQNISPALDVFQKVSHLRITPVSFWLRRQPQKKSGDKNGDKEIVTLM
jgi:hypothetical protein